MAMGKVYDIISKLTNNKPIIRLAEDKEFEVNNSKNSAILIKQITEDPKIDDIERMDKIIEAGLGKEALDYINSLDLSMNAYGAIINSIMAALNDMDLEEVEKLSEAEMKKIKKK